MLPVHGGHECNGSLRRPGALEAGHDLVAYIWYTYILRYISILIYVLQLHLRMCTAVAENSQRLSATLLHLASGSFLTRKTSRSPVSSCRVAKDKCACVRELPLIEKECSVHIPPTYACINRDAERSGLSIPCFTYIQVAFLFLIFMRISCRFPAMSAQHYDNLVDDECINGGQAEDGTEEE